MWNKFMYSQCYYLNNNKGKDVLSATIECGIMEMKYTIDVAIFGIEPENLVVQTEMGPRLMTSILQSGSSDTREWHWYQERDPADYERSKCISVHVLIRTSRSSRDRAIYILLNYVVLLYRLNLFEPCLLNYVVWNISCAFMYFDLCRFNYVIWIMLFELCRLLF